MSLRIDGVDQRPVGRLSPAGGLIDLATEAIGSATPGGPAAGDLAGAYPNPTIAALVITDANVAAANKDGVAATFSMRTLGTGVQQAVAGNRLPTLAAGSVLFSDGAAVAQDNANLFWDDANNRLGIGTASPSARLTIVEDHVGASIAGISITGHRSDGPPRPVVTFFAGRGTPAAPADVVTDDGLGELIGQGYAGGAFRTVASITMNADPGTISATSLPSGIRFRTTPDGSIIRQERMRITSEGNVGINTTTPIAPLHVAEGSFTLPDVDNRRVVISDPTFAAMSMVSEAAGEGHINFGSPTDIDVGRIIYRNSTNQLGFGTNATSDHMIIDANGKVSTVMGAAFGSFSAVGGVADSQFIDVGNVGLGEDILQTFTLPADALSANGKAIRIRATFLTANNANVKTIKLHFGATVIANSGPASIDNRVIYFDVIVVRTGASAQRSTALRIEGVDGASADNTLMLRKTPAEDTTGAIIIKGTGETTTDVNDDVIQESMLVEFLN